MHTKRTLALTLALSLLTAAGAVLADQTCRDDIPPSAPDSRFTDHGNGTVTDSLTGLTWKRCAEGLSGTQCDQGTAVTLDWSWALKSAARSVFAGYKDWRLPNVNELESLVEQRCYGPAINARFFPNTPGGWFWSSSSDAYSPYDAWLVYFHYGYVGDGYKYYAEYVRLVRGGQ